MTQVIIWTAYTKENNFQANQHSIVGAEIYQYGENIVVEIEGKYWLYENYPTQTSTETQTGTDPHSPITKTSGEEVSEQDPAAN